MNILLYEWNTFGQKDLEDALIHMGHKVNRIKYVFTDFEKDEAFEKRLEGLFLMQKYDVVFSFNFFQIISKVCNKFCIKYIAWVWDSPLLNLNSTAVYHSVNYIFIFDRQLYRQMKYELGVDTVYYLPLAVNVDRLNKLEVHPEDCKRFGSEVSFVGSLYEKRSHFDEIPMLSEYLKGYFDGIMRAQMNIHGYNFIRDMLTEEIMEELEGYISIRPGNQFVGDIKDIFADRFLNTKITGMERRRSLRLLSDICELTVYSGSDTSDLPNVRNGGYIDYYTVMPKVFRCSRINLNFTVRTIKSGIPLRIFDILGAGGFLITNYQEELSEYFEIGRDLVVYESEEDLLEKVAYYLQHEEERKEIAENGHRKVQQYHSYEVRLQEIFLIISGVGEAGESVDGVSASENGRLQEQIWNQMGQLIFEGRTEEAKKVYYSFGRSYPKGMRNKQFSDFDRIFQIYSYEVLRKQHTLLEYSQDINQIWGHFDQIRRYIREAELATEEAIMPLIHYIELNQVSYTAIISIIDQYSTDKVRLLNRIAWSFLEKGRTELVIPFLSFANQLAPEDDETLYHLAYTLNLLGEYQMAYEYIDKITITEPEALELMKEILRNIE